MGKSVGGDDDTGDEVKKVLSKLDANGDGKIDLSGLGSILQHSVQM